MFVVNSIFNNSEPECDVNTGNCTKTEELVDWLSKVANKRLKLRRQRQPDYRKEAMIEVSLLDKKIQEVNI